MATITVKVAGRGIVCGGETAADPATEAVCELCGRADDVVVSTSHDGGSPFACRGCLRHRLEATTLALYELRSAETSGLPWGKISG